MVKLEESRDQGAGSFLGAERTPGLVSARLSNVSPGLPEFPRWRARGLSERTAKPEAGAEARWVAWCQGRRSVGCLQRAGDGPALRAPGRSPLARLCRPRPAGSVELGPPPRRPPACSRSFGNPAPGRSSRRRARPSAGTAPSREGAQLRRSGAATAAPAVGCRAKLQPAPCAPGLSHLGPDRRGAGRGGGPGGAEAPERSLRAPLPGSPVPSVAEGADGDLPEKGEKNPRNS